MSGRAHSLLMSLHPERKKKVVECRVCHSSTHLTKTGLYYKHRMPPMNLGYGMPNYAGPICKASGTPANRTNPPNPLAQVAELR